MCRYTEGTGEERTNQTEMMTDHTYLIFLIYSNNRLFSTVTPVEGLYHQEVQKKDNSGSSSQTMGHMIVKIK
jgi:hypothetical protein